MEGCTTDKLPYIYFLRLFFSVTTIVLSQLILHTGLMNAEGQQNNCHARALILEQVSG